MAIRDVRPTTDVAQLPVAADCGRHLLLLLPRLARGTQLLNRKSVGLAVWRVILILFAFACYEQAPVPRHAKQTSNPRPAPTAHANESADPCERPPFAVDGNIRAPRVLKRIDPDFAECHTREGTVIIELRIGIDGKPRNLRVVRSASPCLDAKALEAARQWTICPAKLNGRAIETTMMLTIQKHQTRSNSR